MLKTVLRVLCLVFAMAFVVGCGPARTRATYDPGHKHAEEVGELTLPNGQ